MWCDEATKPARTGSPAQQSQRREITSDGTWNYTYDANGNETQKTIPSTGETWTYTYNVDNRLIEANHKPTTLGAVDIRDQFSYDVLGNRIAKTVGVGPTTTTKFAYDANGNAWVDYTGTSTVIARHVFGMATDDLIANITAGSTTWYLKDVIGSVRDLMNATGTAITDHLDYSTFGKATESIPGTADRYQWTSREFDKELGLQYNRARYYDANTQRWLSQDPLGFDAGDSNLYRYANNGPTGATDPSGMREPAVTNAQKVREMEDIRSGGQGGAREPILLDIAKETNKQVGKVATGLAGDLIANKKYRLFIPTGAKDTQVLQIRDMTAGRLKNGIPVGESVFAVDGPHMGPGGQPLGPHINVKEPFKGYLTKGLKDHTEIPNFAYKGAKYGGKALQFAQKAAKPVAIFSDGVRVLDAFAMDEWSVGENTITVVAIVGGEWGGGIAGAKGGAIIGLLIAGPPGALIGGILGGIGGSYAGGYLVETGITAIKEAPRDPMRQEPLRLR